MQKKKIQIDNRGTFEVYGTKPWFLMPVEASDRSPAGWVISSSDIFKSDKVHRLNCLIKITDQGARIPVIFTGNGAEIGQEIVEIINAKL